MTAPSNFAEATARRDRIIDEALADGRITKLSAPRWRAMLFDDEANTTTLLASLTPVRLADAEEAAAFSAGAHGNTRDHHYSDSNDPASRANFRAAAVRNAESEAYAERMEAAEKAEALRWARAMGVAW